MHNVLFLDFRVLLRRSRNIGLPSNRLQLVQSSLPVLLPRQPDIILVTELFLLPQTETNTTLISVQPDPLDGLLPVVFNFDDLLPPSTDFGGCGSASASPGATLVAGPVPALAALSHFFLCLARLADFLLHKLSIFCFDFFAAVFS